MRRAAHVRVRTESEKTLRLGDELYQCQSPFPDLVFLAGRQYDPTANPFTHLWLHGIVAFVVAFCSTSPRGFILLKRNGGFEA